MNNLPKFNNQADALDHIDIDTNLNSSGAKSPLLHRLYNLPISYKTGLIPWFSFGGLILVLGAGGLILYGTLKRQLFKQAESRLAVKSQIIEILLAGDSPDENLPVLEKTITAFTGRQGYSAIYSRQSNGEFTLSSSSTNVDGEINLDLALLDNQIIDFAVDSNGRIVERIGKVDDKKYVLAAQTIADGSGQLVGVLIHGSSLGSINSVIRSSLLAQGVLSLVILVLIIALSKILEQAIAEPIQTLQKVAQDFTEGKLQARATVSTTDEVGLLGTTFNILAESIVINEAKLKQDLERSRSLKEITLAISEAVNLTEILQTAVDTSRKVLNADRVIYFRFDENWQGKVIAESLDPEFPPALDAEINDPCFAEGYADSYRKGQVKAIANIHQSGLNECHLKMLEPFAVIASLIKALT